MHECLLCKRDMKTSKDTFGNGCVRNIYSFLGMNMPKKVMLREPADVLFREGKVVQAIVEDKNFRSNINNIIKEYGKNCNEFIFDSNVDDRFPMSFAESDLYFAIHDVELKVEGKKQNEKWVLDVKLHDRYDYSEFKKIDKYYKDTKSVPKSIFSSTLYNLAWFSIKAQVMKEYNIDIVFKIDNNFEVIDI